MRDRSIKLEKQNKKFSVDFFFRSVLFLENHFKKKKRNQKNNFLPWPGYEASVGKLKKKVSATHRV
jgi:hypothetical protein